MLSRVANSLYWLSRYVERADNTARLVDVNLQLLPDIRRLDDQTLAGLWMPIVESTGDETLFQSLHETATGADVTEFLVFEAANPNSIISSINHARENARMVRDQLTVEFWEELNRLYLFLNSPAARRTWDHGPHELCVEVKNSSLLLNGLANSTVVRNEGWSFMQAGCFLERADKTSRILDVRHTSVPERGTPRAVSQEDALGWSAILRSCSAWDAYKALHGAEVHPAQIAEFLLLSDNFPRSVRFCVRALDAALRRISGTSSDRFSNQAEKLAGRLLAELSFSSPEDIFAIGLHAYIDQLQARLNDIGNALFQTYIFHAFQTLEDYQLRQQEEQQQQRLLPRA
jgi:uncharacterized alpha-E superfamily protein